MSDIKKLLSKSEEAGKPTEGEHGLLINSLSLLSKKLESELRDCDSIIVDIAIQELESLKTENAELKKQNKWISVDDELPSKDGNYLTYEKGRVHSADHCVCWFSSKYGFDLIGTTHWMPLPCSPL